MSQPSEFVPLDQLSASEHIPENIESDDYVEKPPITPGLYVSPYRTITAKQKPDGNIVFKVNFTGGLVSAEDSGRSYKFGPDSYLSTKPFKTDQGETSQVAQYLRAVGLSTKTNGETVTSRMAASANMPVKVYIGWENRTEKQGDGTYPKPTKRTRDFKKADGSYAPSITVDGINYIARAKVSAFRKIA